MVGPGSIETKIIGLIPFRIKSFKNVKQLIEIPQGLLLWFIMPAMFPKIEDQRKTLLFRMLFFHSFSESFCIFDLFCEIVRHPSGKRINAGLKVKLFHQ